MCQACVPEVFETEDKKAEVTAGEGLEEYRPVGGDAVLQESIDAAAKRKAAPTIKDIEKLSLLGM